MEIANAVQEVIARTTLLLYAPAKYQNGTVVTLIGEDVLKEQTEVVPLTNSRA